MKGDFKEKLGKRAEQSQLPQPLGLKLSVHQELKT